MTLNVTPTFAIVFFACIGLCIGSFLNVVIVRLPKMLEQSFRRAEVSAESTSSASDAPLTLSQPPSHCPHCQHPLRWFENIPLISFMALRGRCSRCRQAIAWRYPIVELVTGVLFAYCAWRWHFSLTAASYALWAASLWVLAWIDWETTYLPDDITIPLVWAGLLAAACELLPNVSLHQSFAGACAGYLSLWTVYWGFKLITGRDGMGYGDFKLLAAIGAWLGWQALIPVIIVSAGLGVVVGAGLRLMGRDRTIEGARGYIPFGPLLVLGAFVEWVTAWQP